MVVTVWVAVISDTHGVLRPEVKECLKGCDCIFHAGDFDDEETLKSLKAYAPLYGVRGNNDAMPELPPVRRFKIEGLNFLMVHRRIDVPKNVTDVDMVIFGHSHRYFCQYDGGVLWLNPGSCGRRRFGLELSFVMLRLEGRTFDVEKKVIVGAHREFRLR